MDTELSVELYTLKTAVLLGIFFCIVFLKRQNQLQTSLLIP